MSGGREHTFLLARIAAMAGIAITALAPDWLHAADAPVGAERPHAPPSATAATVKATGDKAGPARTTPGKEIRDSSVRPVDRLELDPTAVTGNRELPKVMSIVPWKNAEPPSGP